MIRNTVALAFALLCLGQPVAAQTARQSAQDGPAQITANQFVLDENTREATFTGDVVVQHPVVTVWAPEVAVLYGPGGTSDVRSFEANARDGVIVRLQTKDQTATGNKAVFDPSEQVLELTGNVVVNNGAGIPTGPSLVVNLVNNTSVFTGGDGGRVTGVFSAQ